VKVTKEAKEMRWMERRKKGEENKTKRIKEKKLRKNMIHKDVKNVSDKEPLGKDIGNIQQNSARSCHKYQRAQAVRRSAQYAGCDQQ
jgi:hypothetical protein